MMKKEYKNPSIEVTVFESEDIITTSSQSFGGNQPGDTSFDWSNF